MEGYVQDAPRKELHIVPFVECFKTTLWESVTDSIYRYKMPKHYFFVDTLLIESYVQGALRKELLIAPFVEHFKVASLESLPNKFCQ